jgi:hypothetical protein
MTEIMETDAATFVILPVGSDGYAAKIRYADDGGSHLGLGFQDEAAARAWVARNAPAATDVTPHSP